VTAEPRRWPLDPIAVALGLGFGLAVSKQPVLAMVAVIGIAFGLLVVDRPARMVPVLFLAILFDKLGASGVKLADFPVTASKLSVVGLLGVWGLHVILSRARPARWHPVLGGLGVFAASTAFTLTLTGQLGEGKFTLFGLLMMMVLVGLVFAILAEEDLAPLYRSIGCVLAGIFLLSLKAAGAEGEAARATGTMGDPNEWATMVFVVTPFVLGGLTDEDHWVARPLRMALVGLAPLSVLASGSRAALIVLVLVTPGVLYLMRRRRGELGLVAGAGALVAPFVLDFSKGMERFQSLWLRLQGESTVTGDNSLDERTELFHQGLQLFLDNLLFGSGPGTFGAATGFVSETGRLRPAHNSYLEVAAEQGLLGLLCAGFFLATVGVTLWRGWRGALRPRDRNRVAGVAIGLAAVATMAATLGLITFSMAYLVLGFGLAVVHQATRGG